MTILSARAHVCVCMYVTCEAVAIRKKPTLGY